MKMNQLLIHQSKHWTVLRTKMDILVLGNFILKDRS